MLSLSTTSLKFINYSSSMAPNIHFLRVSRICTPCITIHSQLIFQAMCEFSRPKSHKPKFPHLYQLLKCALGVKPEPFSLKWYPQSTRFVFWWYSVKPSVHTTWCISGLLLLNTSVILVFPNLMINYSFLESFHIVATRWNQILYICL